jgi:hypothetical protein
MAIAVDSGVLDGSAVAEGLEAMVTVSNGVAVGTTPAVSLGGTRVRISVVTDTGIGDGTGSFSPEQPAPNMSQINRRGKRV